MFVALPVLLCVEFEPCFEACRGIALWVFERFLLEWWGLGEDFFVVGFSLKDFLFAAGPGLEPPFGVGGGGFLTAPADGFLAGGDGDDFVDLSAGFGAAIM